MKNWWKQHIDQVVDFLAVAIAVNPWFRRAFVRFSIIVYGRKFVNNILEKSYREVCEEVGQLDQDEIDLRWDTIMAVTGDKPEKTWRDSLGRNDP